MITIFSKKKHHPFLCLKNNKRNRIQSKTTHVLSLITNDFLLPSWYSSRKSVTPLLRYGAPVPYNCA